MTRDDDGSGKEVEAAEAETRLISDTDDTVLADEDDRTQLVPRSGSEVGSDSASDGSSESGTGSDSGDLAATRVLDPTQASTAEEADELAATRVLDDPDKTAPPPVSPAAVAAGAAAARAETPARPAVPRPTPIDPDRGLAPGTVLFGEYEIVNVLGVGGMGEVYRAKHRRLGEHRAIKVMHAELSKKKGASEFFYREAKALLAVRHPAVAHCHDLLSDDEGRVYLIMEMIEGIPLSKKMNDGPLSPDDVAILGARVSHGLSAAHRKGVIHRDVSPDNIVLPNGRVQEAKIIDFGIAKLLEEGEGTIVDGFKGKLSYASPEQLGFFGGKIDGRSDFYSLGLVLVAAAMGRPLAMGTTVVEAVDARRSFKTLPDAIPMGLRSAIQPLLALDPDDRPKYVDRLFVVPGGQDNATDSQRISTGGVVRSGGTNQTSGNRMGLIAGAAALVTLLLGGGFFMTSGGSGSTTPTTLATSAAVEPTSETLVESPSASGSQAAPNATPTTEAAPAVVAAVEPATPRPRRISGRDRLKIVGLMGNARDALAENRLMSPAGNNAYDKYQQVLAIDPNHRAAKSGLRDIAVRYVSLAQSAIQKGDLDRAKTFVERARKADSTYSGIARVAERL